MADLGDVQLVDHGNGTVSVLIGDTFVGQAFPKVTARPDGIWYGKFRYRDAEVFGSRAEAVAYLAGGMS